MASLPPAPTAPAVTAGLTLPQVVSALPPNLKGAVSQVLVDKLNAITNDPLIAEEIGNNFISYTSVLREGKFKIEDYMSAVAYVSYKLMGYSNQDAWARTFPSRHAALVSRGAAGKEISAHVAAYNKTKLVNLILEQTLVPSWVLNQHIFQKAINVQADLMINSNSEKVRSDAANSLLTHLKKPEGKDFQISIETNDNSGMNELKQALADMAAAQRSMIENGVGIRKITDARIIEARPEATLASGGSK